MPQADKKVTAGQLPDAADAFLAEARDHWAGVESFQHLYVKWAADLDRTGGGTEYAWMARSLLDVPRLLEAVEAALKPHQPGRVVIVGELCEVHESHRHFSITSTEAAGITACPECPATVYRACSGCFASPPFDHCTVRTAITEALTRERSTRD